MVLSCLYAVGLGHAYRLTGDERRPQYSGRPESVCVVSPSFRKRPATWSEIDISIARASTRVFLVGAPTPPPLPPPVYLACVHLCCEY